MATKFADEKTVEEKNIDENMKLIRSLRAQNIVDINMVRIFIVVWFAAAILAVLPVFRPNYSDVEKRELKKFPKLSLSSLASGKYFDEIGLWFSDTFPMRDKFVSLNTDIAGKYGINDVEVHGEIVQGDEIPDVIEPDASSKPETPPEPPSTPPANQPSEPAVEQIGAMLIVDNTAYEYYHFNREVSDSYAATVNRAAALLDGKSKVYNMIIPTSMAITLPDDIKSNTNSSDQKKAIDYMYSKMTPNVTRVDAYTTLANHKKEYLYFRTDHHWTALGAHYSYRELMKAKGVTPVGLDAFDEFKYEGFLGSFYAESGQKASLGNTPDYVMAYKPKQLQYIKTYTKSGVIDYNIVSNGDKLSAANKYLTFICGDKPYGIMTNPAITDGSSCLVLKESFGNAMVAYLTQHYQNVYVVDYRYIKEVFPGTIVQFVDERGIDDVMFINNISSTRSKPLVNAMAAFVG